MKRFIRGAFSFLLVVVLAGMGDGAKRGVNGVEPSYARLEEGEPSICATIYDETTVTEIQDISFFGHTSIGGIRKEADDSANKLDLGKIQELSIEKSIFESKRFPDGAFCLVKVITRSGAFIEDLLVPRHIIICGIDKKSQMERSWFLNKIDRVVIDRPLKDAEKPEAVIEKAFKAERDKWEKPVTEYKDVAADKVEPVKTVTEKAMIKNSEPKAPDFTESSSRLWAALLDTSNAAFVVIKGWF